MAEGIRLDSAPRNPGTGEGERREGVTLGVEGRQSRSEKRVQMSPFVAYRGLRGREAGSGVLQTATAPQRLGLDDLVTRRGRSAPSSHSWSTSAR